MTQQQLTEREEGARQTISGHLIFDSVTFSTVECLAMDSSFNTEIDPQYCPGCGAEIVTRSGPDTEHREAHTDRV